MLRVWAAVDIAYAVGLRVHPCCTITRLNFRELENFTEYVAARGGVSRINFSRYVPTGRGNDTLDLTDMEWHEVIAQCYELKKRYKSRLEIVTHLAQEILVDDEVLKLPSFIGCQAGRGQGCVTSNGTVFPCVLLPIPIGNIRQTSLRNLWSKSEVIQKLQDRQFLQGYCGDCALKSRCGGCRGSP